MMTSPNSEEVIAVVPAEELIEQPKRICATCIHLIGKRDYPELVDEKWHCGHPDNIKGMDAATGFNVYKNPTMYILTSKDRLLNACQGMYWQEYKRHEDLKEAPQWAASDMDNLANAAATRVAALRQKKLSPKDLSNL